MPFFLYRVYNLLIAVDQPTVSAKIIRRVWFLIGLVYLVVRTRGLKQKPVISQF
jgi:hypothetical protein